LGESARQHERGQAQRLRRALTEAPEHDEGDDRLVAHDAPAVADGDEEAAHQRPEAQDRDVQPRDRAGDAAHEGGQGHAHGIRRHHRQWRAPAGEAPCDAHEHRAGAHGHPPDRLADGDADREDGGHRNRRQQPRIEGDELAVKVRRVAYRSVQRSRRGR
jgi:hypothetical protein